MPNKNHALVALFALTAIGIGSLCISVFANEQQQQRTIMNDPQRDMITTLEARGPHPSIGDQAQTFDRFVGTWDCDYASFKEDGTTEHAKGGSNIWMGPRRPRRSRHLDMDRQRYQRRAQARHNGSILRSKNRKVANRLDRSGILRDQNIVRGRDRRPHRSRGHRRRGCADAVVV
jgi:hypothetical protein